MYVMGHRFLYWRYHEIPRYMCLLDVVGRAMGRWSSVSFHRYWCPLDEIALNRDHVWSLPAISLKYKLTYLRPPDLFASS